MAYDNTNSGAIFKNATANEINRRPPYNGSAEIKCPCCDEVSKFWVSAWVNTAGPQAKNPGQKFFGIKFEAKDDQGEPVQRPATPEDIDDDIPF